MPDIMNGYVGTNAVNAYENGRFLSGRKPPDDNRRNEYKEALNALHLPEILAAYQAEPV